ncbi:MAG: dipeptide epimerase [Rhodoferax sp.]|jgi:L-alanine-DL-glutamate epimerase-like enolase superfamily enzyme|uniref:dipeptide epimerase n=1 Tax=Rhodoferax sp. TaxID=50421 RepID=UPI001B4AA075|nr:dipeptide epimerase [Rhodoferax sp.]MBP8286300.1 dipeptide epimerase [Rhodoferax sp.]MBP9150370.1 dipeptide epimerase [Rhodoferax sp.]MBP9734944.1 dipeptide epimerase [Rhodoferax sp.]
MLINHITVGEVKTPLKVPFKTALRRVDEVHDLVLMISTDTGLTGYGSAAATAVITGDLIDSMRAGLDLLAPKLLGRRLRDFNTLLRTVHQSLVHHSSLKAALEIALYDLRAQSIGLPLYQLLGGGEPQIKTDVTISVNLADVMVKDALRAVAEGFDALKIKVGGQTWRDDVESVLAIHRAVGPNIALYLDANQGWEPKQAVQVIQALEKSGVVLEFVEQPVKAADLTGLKFVCDNTLTPILADEAVFTVANALHILNTRSADVINIKLMKTAGISGALEVASLTRMHHKTCMMGCMLEGAISVTAAAHVAVACDDVVAYVDLDGPQLCKGSAVEGGMRMAGPWIHLSDAPGLGITAVHGLLNVKVYDV